MSFKHRRFVAGGSSDDEAFLDDEDDDPSIRATEDFILESIANDGPEVQSIVDSCVRGIVSVMSLKEKEARLARKRTASETITTKDAPASKSAQVQSFPAPSAAPEATSKEDTEFDRQMKARAMRFGLYGATMNAKADSSSPLQPLVESRPAAEKIPASSEPSGRRTVSSTTSESHPNPPPSTFPPNLDVEPLFVSSGETLRTDKVRDGEDKSSTTAGPSSTAMSISDTLLLAVPSAPAEATKNKTHRPEEVEDTPREEEDDKYVTEEDEEEEEGEDSTFIQSVSGLGEGSEDRPDEKLVVRYRLDQSQCPPLLAVQVKKLTEVLTKGDYNRTVSPEMKSKIERICNEHSFRVSDEVLVKLRHELLVQRASRAHGVLQRHSKEVAERYAKGESIVHIAKSFHAPPVACFRVILQERQMSKFAIKNIITGSTSSLNDRDRHELTTALEQDTTTTEMPDVAKNAAAFEAQIQRMLDEAGLKYQTQADLLASKSPVTPDFLIASGDELYFGDHRIAWIDAKDHFGSFNGFFLPKLKNQIQRYNTAFGPGAVVFSHGLADALVSTLQSLDVVVCDIRWLIREEGSSSSTSGMPKPGSKRTAEAAGLDAGVTGVGREVKEAKKRDVEAATATTTTPSSSSSSSLSAKEAWGRATEVLLAKHKIFEKPCGAALVRGVNALLEKADIEPYTGEELYEIWYDLQVTIVLKRLKVDLKTDPRYADLRTQLERMKTASEVMALTEQSNLHPLMVLKLMMRTKKGRAEARMASLKNHKDLLSMTNQLREPVPSFAREIVDRGLTFFPRDDPTFETKVVSFLASVNVTVSVEAKFRRHLVVHKALTIEGSPIKWIITFPHLGGLIPSDIGRLKNAAKELIDCYSGPGAIVFSLGFTEPIDFKLPHRVVFVDFRLLGLAGSE